LAIAPPPRYANPYAIIKFTTMFSLLSLSWDWSPLSMTTTAANDRFTLPEFIGEDSVHDPSRIVTCGGAYYFFSTGPGVRIWRSDDGRRWKSIGSVFDDVPAWAKMAVPNKEDKSLWAPEVVERSGKYYLYYSVSTWGSNTSAIGLAVADTLDVDDPRYGWDDAGCVIASDRHCDYNAIDPAPIVDDEGRLWLCFGSFFSGIRLIRLDESSCKWSGRDGTVRLLAARYAVTNNPIEAPFIYRRDGYYYLFTSWDYCCRGVESSYNVRVGRSREVEGPYLDRDDVDLRNGGGTAFLEPISNRLGPGQVNIFEIDGVEYVTYHYYDALDGGRSKLGTALICWDPDGWPCVVDTDPDRSRLP
jgi:arabinan endo-1,5-alpha-L-arabinosidase